MPGISAIDQRASLAVSLSSVPTGAGVYFTVIGRRVADKQQYQARVRFLASGAVALMVSRVNGSTETAIGAETVVPNLTLAAGEVLNIEVSFTGAPTTTAAITVWRAGTARPGSPSISRTDSTASLQAACSFGLLGYLSGSATAPVIATIEGLAVTGPR